MNSKIVYLTDDDQDDREFFVEALSKISPETRIFAFSNGVELMDALLKLEDTLPDVLFIDLNMPMMNGEECIIDIRRESKFDTIPIIVYSTASDEEQLSKLQVLGANRYLQKPNTFSSLKSKLKAVLEKLDRIDGYFIPESGFVF